MRSVAGEVGGKRDSIDNRDWISVESVSTDVKAVSCAKSLCA